MRMLVFESAPDDEIRLVILLVGIEGKGRGARCMLVALCFVHELHLFGTQTLTPRGEVAFEKGNEITRGEAKGAVGLALHALRS